MTLEDVAFVAAVNDEKVFATNLLSSEVAGSGLSHVVAQRGYPSASKAYNAALDSVSSDVVTFVHQDVYLPAGWIERLSASIDWLEQRNEPWGVLGVWGIRGDRRFAGRVWCSGGGREHSAQAELPTEVVSIDEVVIVLNRSSGLRFDEDLPGFHLYGTDIIAQAHVRGLKAFVFDGPVVHNSRPNPQVFDRAFFAAYRHMQRKWRDRLPLQTCTVPVTRTGWPLYRAWLKREVRRRMGCGPAGERQVDPRQIAVELGYEQAQAAMAEGCLGSVIEGRGERSIGGVT